MKYKPLIITDLVIFILVGLNYKFRLIAEIYARFFDCPKTIPPCEPALCDVAGFGYPCFSVIHGVSVMISWLVLLIAHSNYCIGISFRDLDG